MATGLTPNYKGKFNVLTEHIHGGEVVQLGFELPTASFAAKASATRVRYYRTALMLMLNFHISIFHK